MDSSDHYEVLANNFKHGLLASLIGAKKLKIIEVIAQNADDDALVRLSIAEIMQLSGASKPTVINTLNALKEVKAIKKLKNGLYKIIIKGSNSNTL